MQIYVGKSGQQLGPFSLEEVNRKLADGSFVATDLAWYEGAPGWGPLSGVPGVILPATTSATPIPTPASAPTPAPVPKPAVSSPISAPVRPNSSIVRPERSRTKTLAIISWTLLAVTFVVSLVPFLGCGAWFMVWPVAVACIIMGIITLSRGATAQGIFIILGAVLLVPLCLVGPVVSLALFGGTLERKQETQIMENLRTIDSAKSRWAAETKAADGAPVTMATLTSQLAGKEIKPATGETYDPMPVGQPPTATLPASTTLGPFSGGDVLTVASLQKALAEHSALNWNLKRDSSAATPSAAPSASPRVSAAPSVVPSPRPSVAPSVSASPNASPSPRSSSAPHSLISPRQNVEPNDSPSSRQSPGGKFAPRTGPRQSPAPSQEQSDSEKSGGLKQGRQYPRESPAATPEKSPDDDDE